MNNKILLIVVVILIPFVVISFNKRETNFLVEKEKVSPKDIYILLNNEKVELEEYLIGVIAAEMPASFHKEALEAQAIAARTFAYKKALENKNLTGTTNDQVYIDSEEMKSKWQEDYNFYYEKIKEAVSKTRGKIITYNDVPINAYYFSMSNGATSSSITVFNEELEYIEPVESNWEKEIATFEKSVEYTYEELQQKLDIQNIVFSNLKYSDNHHLLNLEIDNQQFKGTKFRQLLNLRSTDITITLLSDKIIFTTKGYGHGVGMSQYGANGMAKEGYTAEEIIKYYYKNIEINKI